MDEIGLFNDPFYSRMPENSGYNFVTMKTWVKSNNVLPILVCQHVYNAHTTIYLCDNKCQSLVIEIKATILCIYLSKIKV